ncbi:MAG: polysaccharide deacetylase family protein, partial [Clostridiales bacterium]|nr:polysaccharide deacetylase family protein [Clostridiales bacterium]
MRKRTGRITSLLLCLTLILSGTALWRAAARPAVPVFFEDDEGIALPIIMYHSILNHRNGKYTLSPSVLEADLAWLDEQGFETVTVEDLIYYVYYDGTLPEKPVMLTFDDGHYNNLTYAVPLLEQYGMRAVLAVVGSFTDAEEGQPQRNPNFSYFNWGEIDLLSTSDTIEVQNHSYDMHSGRGAVRGKGESEERLAARLTEDI